MHQDLPYPTCPPPTTSREPDSRSRHAGRDRSTQREARRTTSARGGAEVSAYKSKHPCSRNPYRQYQVDVDARSNLPHRLFHLAEGDAVSRYYPFLKTFHRFQELQHLQRRSSCGHREHEQVLQSSAPDASPRLPPLPPGGRHSCQPHSPRGKPFATPSSPPKH